MYVRTRRTREGKPEFSLPRRRVPKSCRSQKHGIFWLVDPLLKSFLVWSNVEQCLISFLWGVWDGHVQQLPLQVNYGMLQPAVQLAGRCSNCPMLLGMIKSTCTFFQRPAFQLRILVFLSEHAFSHCSKRSSLVTMNSLESEEVARATAVQYGGHVWGTATVTTARTGANSGRRRPEMAFFVAGGWHSCPEWLITRLEPVERIESIRNRRRSIFSFSYSFLIRSD